MLKGQHLLYFTLFALVFSTASCSLWQKGMNVPSRKSIEFSEYDWEIKFAEHMLGPGPNLFADDEENIWVDEDGFLHLTVSKNEGLWQSTEIVSKKNFGYGTYIFTIEGNLSYLDPNVTLGLFTWNNLSFKEEANSEIDIEFARWGRADDPMTLQYAVHPIAGDTARLRRCKTNPIIWNGISTHAFTWTDSLVVWESYLGENYGVGEPACRFVFSADNQGRIKHESGESSNPVIIPKPVENTNVRMNLWLSKGPVIGPKGNVPTEVIIRKFEYVPQALRLTTNTREAFKG